ncbi:MAG: NAD(P)-binding domain-containing protein [Ignavibacteria bacterium]
MKIAILGAGNVGMALANGWAKAGHSIILGLKDPQNEKTSSLLKENITAKTTAEASAEADVILISLPVSATVSVLKEIGNVKEKIIIDATNSVFGKPDPYNNCFEAVKDITKMKKVVKCFNSTGFENMSDPVYEIKIRYVCSRFSEEAKRIAVKLSEDLGFENCYVFGGDDKVDLLEQFAMSWINLAIVQKHGRDIAFKVLKR